MVCQGEALTTLAFSQIPVVYANLTDYRELEFPALAESVRARSES